MLTFKNTFKSLIHRSFRLFFFAQMVSLIGTWVQGVAQSWLLWRLTNSQGLLGLLGFAQMSPVLFFGLIGGIFADRFERKKLLLLTQSLALLQAVVFASLIIFNLINPFLIFLLAFALGTINAFDMTLRQTFLADLVGLKDVGNAIALNSLLFNLARVIGPPIGGFVIAHYGESICFIANAVSFLFVLLALLMIKIENPQGKKSPSSLTSIKETFQYFKKQNSELRVLLLLSTVSLLLLPYAYFLPYFADKVLKGNSETLGFLLSSAGFGAALGAIVMANNSNIKQMPYLVGIFSLILSFSMILFSFSTSVILSSIFLVLAGFSTMISASSSNIFLQTKAPPSMRGRIISFYVTTFVGFPPLGGLFIGTLTLKFNTSIVLLVCSLITAIFSLLYLFSYQTQKLKEATG